MESICGIDCNDCKSLKRKRCDGCKKTDGNPFGKKCFIADYICVGGKDNYEKFKKEIINEFNSIKIEGKSDIDELYAVNGDLVNLEYPLPNGKKVKLLDDKEIYFGNQIESEFNNDEVQKYFGLVANSSFLLICEYDKGAKNPEIIIFKRR